VLRRQEQVGSPGRPEGAPDRPRTTSPTMSMRMHKTLRVGLLLDSYELPLWEYALIDRLVTSSYATVKLVILNDDKKKTASLLRRAIGNWRHILFSLYTRVDAKLFDVQPNAFEPTDATALLDGIQVLKVKPICSKFSDRFRVEDISEVERHDLDILLRFGFRILKGGILRSARYGIWSYHHGDSRVNRGGPAGFWEVFERWPVTGSVLQILSEELDAGKVLCRSFSQTDQRSVHRNRNNYYWKSVSFVPRMMRELCTLGAAEFFDNVDEHNKGLNLYSNRLFSAKHLTNRKMFALLTVHCSRYFRDKCVGAIYFDQWTLFFDIKKGVLPTSFWKFKAIVPPKDKFFADPFVTQRDNTYYIYIEEFVFRTNKGHISVIEMDQKGRYKAPVPVVDEAHHLSYPFVFRHQGDDFMVPESGAKKTVDLYQCIEFPFKWEFRMHLMEGIEAIDTTLFHYQDVWWLFANVVENRGASDLDELFLFYSDELRSTAWTPHPLNPIVSDVRTARPAGRIFVRGGKIIRPSQNSSRRYGFGMKMNEIRVLDKENYEELEIQSIEPDWNTRLMATHTFNQAGNMTVIDGNMRRRRVF
jgi:hypothetical protein